MPDNEIYTFLKNNNLTTKDEVSFVKEYSDPAKAQELHNFFTANKLTTKDSAVFYDTYLKPSTLSKTPNGTTTPPKVETPIKAPVNTFVEAYKADPASATKLLPTLTEADIDALPIPDTGKGILKETRAKMLPEEEQKVRLTNKETLAFIKGGFYDKVTDAEIDALTTNQKTRDWYKAKKQELISNPVTEAEILPTFEVKGKQELPKPDAYSTPLYKEGYKQAVKSATTDKEEDTDQYFLKLAEGYMAQGKYDLGASLAKQVAEKNPYYKDYYYRLQGIANKKSGNLAESAKAFDLIEKPTLDDISNNAYAKAETGDVAGALKLTQLPAVKDSQSYEDLDAKIYLKGVEGYINKQAGLPTSDIERELVAMKTTKETFDKVDQGLGSWWLDDPYWAAKAFGEVLGESTGAYFVGGIAKRLGEGAIENVKRVVNSFKEVYGEDYNLLHISQPTPEVSFSQAAKPVTDLILGATGVAFSVIPQAAMFMAGIDAVTNIGNKIEASFEGDASMFQGETQGEFAKVMGKVMAPASELYELLGKPGGELGKNIAEMGDFAAFIGYMKLVHGGIKKIKSFKGKEITKEDVAKIQEELKTENASYLSLVESAAKGEKITQEQLDNLAKDIETFSKEENPLSELKAFQDAIEETKKVDEKAALQPSPIPTVDIKAPETKVDEVVPVEESKPDVVEAPKVVDEAPKGDVADVKAQETPDILIQYAKKYKSADEFISAITDDRGGIGKSVEYSPWKRIVETENNDAPLTDFGFKPDDKVTIYRGVDNASQNKITSGDYIATSYDLAKSYTGGDVISKEVPASSVRFSSGDGITAGDFKKGFNEAHLEGIYNPEELIKQSQLKDIWEKAQALPLVEVSQEGVTGKATETGKAIEQHPEVKTDVKTVVKELNYKKEDSEIYDVIKDLPTKDRPDAITDYWGEQFDKEETNNNRLQRELEDAETPKDVKRLKKELKQSDNRLSSIEKNQRIDYDESEKMDELNTMVDRINARLETRKAVKQGTDLFPEDANIPEFKAVKNELNKHIENGNATKEVVNKFEQRTADEVAKSESVVEAIESKGADAKTDAERQAVIDDVDKEIGNADVTPEKPLSFEKESGDFKKAATKEHEQYKKYHPLEIAVNEDGSVSVAHSVTGSDVATITPDGKIDLKNNKFEKEVNTIRDNIVRELEILPIQREIDNLKKYPLRNAEMITKLERQIKDINDVTPEAQKPELSKKEIAKQKLDEARANFRKAGGLSSGGLETLPEFVDLVKAAVDYGIESAKEFIKEFRDDINKKWSDKEVEDAFDKLNKAVVDEVAGEQAKETKVDEIHLVAANSFSDAIASEKFGAEAVQSMIDALPKGDAANDILSGILKNVDTKKLEVNRKNIINGNTTISKEVQAQAAVDLALLKAKDIELRIKKQKAIDNGASEKELRAIDTEILDNDVAYRDSFLANRMIGTEWGQFGQFRGALNAVTDKFNIVDMEAEYKAKNNIKGDLTEEQKKEIKDAHDGIKDAEADVEKIKRLDAEIAKLKEDAENQQKMTDELNKVLEDYKNKAGAAKEKTKTKVERIDTKVNNAKNKLKSLTYGRASAMGILNPEIYKAIKDIISGKIEKLYEETKGKYELKTLLKETLDEAKQYMPELTKQDIEDAMSGNYKKPKQTKTELAKTKEELKKEVKLRQDNPDIEFDDNMTLDEIQNKIDKAKEQKKIDIKSGKKKEKLSKEQERIKYETEKKNKEAIKRKYKQIQQVTEDIQNKKYKKPDVVPFKKSERLQTAERILDQRKKKWRADRKKDLMKQRPLAEKVIDTMNDYVRASNLSYIGTQFKLLGVVAHNLTTKIPRSLVQKVTVQMIPKEIRKYGGTWGDFELKQLAEYYVNHIKTFQLETLKRVFGKDGDHEFINDMDIKVFKYPGKTHMLIKEFIKQPEIIFSQEAQVYQALKNIAEAETKLKDKTLSAKEKQKWQDQYDEFDVSNPNVMQRISDQALADGSYQILMNNGKLGGKIKSLFGLGKSKDLSVRLATKFLWTSQNTIVTVPINYFSRYLYQKYGAFLQTMVGDLGLGGKGQHVPGIFELFGKRLFDKDAFENVNLPPEIKKQIVKNIVNGSYTAMAAGIALLTYSNITYDKDKKQYTIYGLPITEKILHLPLMDVILSYATTFNDISKTEGDVSFGKYIITSLENDYRQFKNMPFYNQLMYGYISNVLDATKYLAWGQPEKAVKEGELGVAKLISTYTAPPGFVRELAKKTDERQQKGEKLAPDDIGDMIAKDYPWWNRSVKTRKDKEADKEYDKALRDAAEAKDPTLKEERIRKVNIDFLKDNLPEGQTVSNNATYDETKELRKKLSFDKEHELWQINKDAGKDMTDYPEPALKTGGGSSRGSGRDGNDRGDSRGDGRKDGGLIGGIIEKRKTNRARAILESVK